MRWLRLGWKASRHGFSNRRQSWVNGWAVPAGGSASLRLCPLPEEARGAIAAILHIPEKALKPGPGSDETLRLTSAATPRPLLPASVTDPTQTATAKRREGLVPVYECHGPMNDAAATEWVERGQEI